MQFTYLNQGRDPVVKHDRATPETLAHLSKCWNCGAEILRRTIIQRGDVADCAECRGGFRVEVVKVRQGVISTDGAMTSRAALCGQEAYDFTPIMVLGGTRALCGSCGALGKPVIRGGGEFRFHCEECGGGFEGRKVWLDCDHESVAPETRGFDDADI